jgi:hypothetical protein
MKVFKVLNSILFIVLISISEVFAWGNASVASVSEMGVFYPFPSENQIIVYFDYADYRVKNELSWIELNKQGNVLCREIESIDIVFTKYPKKKEDWLTNYDYLLKERISSLESFLNISFFTENTPIHLILQTDCVNEQQAMNMFHGAIVKYKHVISEDNQAFSYQYPHDFIRVKDIIKGGDQVRNPLISNVFSRNNWTDMLIVTDWTASMYDYGAQVVSWLESTRKHQEVNNMVFFNDGDFKFDSEKLIGSTGGVYFCKPGNLETILDTMHKAMVKGQGGDNEENNIEAMLKGIENTISFKELILIADNLSGVRDLPLLRHIKVPVRVIVCRADNHDPVHPDLLKIAYYTKGSIHTIDQDIDMSQLRHKDVLQVSGILYQFHKKHGLKGAGFDQIVSKNKTNLFGKNKPILFSRL